ncbi:glycosyl hydrolase family 18 protein [Paenibacillus aceris]|uniref:Spore germination protein YaaH n=1 Tax=Paenibacillus aceris TaxID=869555 RepID=A0ABS4I0T0_9BACL|nr:glycosyl hydrolase family 18 protein [Paenibacillus aceris]MBP1964495.1 spore germination protein YaaH [Paenibacillus aceris]
MSIFKKVVVQATALFVLVSTGSVYAYDVSFKPFTDVSNQDWFQNEVYSLSAIGIIDGYPDLTYKPDGILTREAFIKLLMTAKQQEVASSTIVAGAPADIEQGRWSYPYVAAAFERKWIDFMLDSEHKLHPETAITREEVASVVGKALLDSQTAEARDRWMAQGWKAEKEKRSFVDREAMKENFGPYAYYAVNQGIMEGDQTGFHPQQSLTRKEAAAIIYRLINKEVAARELEKVGFYAIRSYTAIQRLPLLNQVTLGWSHLEYSATGTAKLETASTEYRIPTGWEEVVQSANTAKINKDLMVYYGEKNLKDFLKDEPAQKAFIQSLKAVVTDSKYGFTGVTMDFEGLMDEASAPDYILFLKALKAALPTYPLSVAVQPEYYYKGYDLKEISALADTVILMAYDFTHLDSKLPSAPLPLVNDAVKRTLASVPKEKLVLGVSKQANQWITANGQSELMNPEIEAVEKRLMAPGVNQSVSLPFFLREITFQDDRGSHEVYYEDTTSIEKKLWLAKFYGLKGISLWYMGNYTDSDWALFQEK